MCCIFQCFGWAIDVLQRSLTLILSCLIGLAVCCGLTVAIITGVAYGYNYSLSEFMEIAKPEVTVFIRRGQFYDEPNISPQSGRRADKDEDNIFANKDYEDKGETQSAKPLNDKWLNAQDIKRYGDKLGKYSQNAVNVIELSTQAPNLIKQSQILRTLLPQSPDPPERTTVQQVTTGIRRLATAPMIVPTAIWKDGSSSIVMRKFYPTIESDLLNTQIKVLDETTDTSTPVNFEADVTVDTDSFYDVPGLKRIKISTMTTKLVTSTGTDQFTKQFTRVGLLSLDDEEEQRKVTLKIPTRHYWGIPTNTEKYDEQPDILNKVDEDNILYRADDNY